MNKSELLYKVPIFSRLTSEHLELLAANMAAHTFERGETIFHQGSTGSTLYIIVSGQVRIYRVSEMGQELTVTLFRENDFFGELALLDNQPRSASAEAMTRTTTLTLQRSVFLHVVQEYPPIAIAVLEALSLRLRHSNTYAEHLSSHSAPQRILHQLVDLAMRHQKPDDGVSPIELRLTQNELASLSGTTRETVNRVLANLRDQGIVRVERAHVSVLNLVQLEQLLAQT